MPHRRAHNVVVTLPAMGSTPPDLCAIALDDGPLCGQASLPGSPAPVCAEHAAVIYRHVASMLAEHALSPTVQVNAISETNCRGLSLRDLSADVMRGLPSVVYYARIGGHIKIGWTGRLLDRMRWYPPCARLLAIEPGDRSTEKARHHQFAHLRVARYEWFSPGPELLAHVSELSECVRQ